MNKIDNELDEEELWYSYAQEMILSYALYEAKDKFMRKGYEIPHFKIKSADKSRIIMDAFDNDTEISYTALMEGHCEIRKIKTDYKKNIEAMGKRLVMLCQDEFKRIIRELEQRKS